jgi:hypothetical protein
MMDFESDDVKNDVRCDGWKMSRRVGDQKDWVSGLRSD